MALAAMTAGRSGAIVPCIDPAAEWERKTSMTSMNQTETALERSVVDHLLECYVAWREECRAVTLAYDEWAAQSSARDSDLLYAAYRAALDQEEESARVYARRIDAVRQIYA
jgi:hypothetical protein